MGPPGGRPPVGQPPVGRPPVGQPPVGQPPVGQPPVGRPPVGRPPVGRPHVGQPPLGQPPVAEEQPPLQRANFRRHHASTDEHTPHVSSNSSYTSNVSPNDPSSQPQVQHWHYQQQQHQQPYSTQDQQQHEQLNQQTSINMNSNHQQSQNEDDVDGPQRAGVRTNVRVNVSTEQEVCDSTPDILTSFIVDRMQYDGHKVPPGLSNRGRRNESAIAVVLRQMGDDISRNYQLNHYISEIQVTPNTAYKTFASVACQIFTDGNINWGRVVMLFYFAYKLALQVLNQLPLIDLIIGWVTQFITERIATWISNQGGWNAIREYYGSTTGQMVGVFLAGILVSTLFWYWRK